MADEPVVEGEGSPKKKSGLVMLIIGVALLTVGGVGGGWVVGGDVIEDAFAVGLGLRPPSQAVRRLRGAHCIRLRSSARLAAK